MLATASKEIVKVVQLMLLNFGITARLKPSNFEGNYRIEMYGEDIVKYRNSIGFNLKYKIDDLNKKCVKVIKANFKAQSYVIPNGKVLLEDLKNSILKEIKGGKLSNIFTSKIKILFNNVVRGRTNLNYKHIKSFLEELDIKNIAVNSESYKKLRYLLDNRFYFNKIKSISKNKAQLYDLEVPEVHNFISNGIISHNCQGSEYPVVFVLLDDQNPMLLIRKILYTAVSRGKQKVYILSKKGSVDSCINNDYYKERITKLKYFLKEINSCI